MGSLDTAHVQIVDIESNGGSNSSFYNPWAMVLLQRAIVATIGLRQVLDVDRIIFSYEYRGDGSV